MSGDERFSLFSKALAEVLEPQCSASTLKEILDETQNKLDALVTEYKKEDQKIYYSFESSVSDKTLSRVICEGKIKKKVEEEGNPWTKAILQSSLWQDENPGNNSMQSTHSPLSQ